MDNLDKDEELQILFASSPNPVIRHGNGIILLLLLSIGLLSAFIRYPETIRGNVSLHVYPTSAMLTAKSTGHFNLLVKDGQAVEKGMLLGYIDNPSSFEDALYFSKYIDSLTIDLSKGSELSSKGIKMSLKLGELQPFYVSLLNSFNTNNQYQKFNNYKSQKRDISEQIASNKELRKKQLRNLEIAFNELRLMEKKFRRDSFLYERKVISLAEFESSGLQILPYKRAYETLSQNLVSTEGEIYSLNTKAKITNNENESSNSEYGDNLKEAILTAKGQIDLWKEKYLFIAPVAGSVSMVNSWSSFQNLAIGNEVMSIIPQKQGVVGKAEIIASGTGKMKQGNEAIINVDDFPQEEFGTIKGKVSALPKFQTNGQYTVIISIPGGMTTNFAKKIPLKEGMSGSVRIITNNTSLLMRLFFQLKKAFNNISSQ